MLEGCSRRERLPGIFSGHKDTCWCPPCQWPRRPPVRDPAASAGHSPVCSPHTGKPERSHSGHTCVPSAPCSPQQPAHRPGRLQGRPQRTAPPPTHAAGELRRPRPHWCPRSQRAPTSAGSRRRLGASCWHPRVSPVVCPVTPDKLQSDSTSQLLWYPVAKPQFRQWGLTPFQVHPSSRSQRPQRVPVRRTVPLYGINNSYARLPLSSLLCGFYFLIGPRLLHQDRSYLGRKTNLSKVKEWKSCRVCSPTMRESDQKSTNGKTAGKSPNAGTPNGTLRNNPRVREEVSRVTRKHTE